jgi:membrane protease subunit HflC
VGVGHRLDVIDVFHLRVHHPHARPLDIEDLAHRQGHQSTEDRGLLGDEERGEGDAERNRIFAEAYGRDPDFFAFYRSMQAYEASLKGQDTRLVISPTSDFFRYFGDPKGGVAGPAAAKN